MPAPYDELSDRTIDLLGLADAHRWVVIKTLRQQNVAEHSFAVAVVALELAERLSIPSDTVHHILLWSLMHDAPETLTGDIDGGFKKDHPHVGEAVKIAESLEFPWYVRYRDAINPIAYRIVKVADKLETLHFIRTWGHGSRADDVFRELTKDLWGIHVPMLTVIMPDREVDIAAAVRTILDQSMLESNSIQMRRFRNR